MACGDTDTFRVDHSSSATIPANTTELKTLCKATKIIERLHKDFTEKYVASDTVDTIKHKPSYHLRDQLASLKMTEENSAPKNRFYTIFTTKEEGDPSYNGVVSAILKGAYDTTTGYKNNPNEISSATDFTNPAKFKGIYGLHKVTELLEGEIRKKIESITPKTTENANISDFNKYQKRQGIKATMEEIANRENQIYREKFLNIILVVIGIFIVSTQLVHKYFSFGDGGGGGGGGGFGFGGISGWLSTRFGSGSGGLFSRFGGIGLGSSGRSRIGNLFTRSPYESTRR
jgi:hypothetical protein